MRAAIYPGNGGPVTIETLADPRPGPGEVLIRVSRCGICGTDLAMTRGGAWDYGSGVQFGHEYAGEIVELGREVSALRVGDRIAVMPSLACGRCTSCRAHGNAGVRTSRARPCSAFRNWPRSRKAPPPSCPRCCRSPTAP